jgi:hypothetical protein
MSTFDSRIIGATFVVLLATVAGLKVLEYLLTGSVWWGFDPRSVIPAFFIHRLLACDAGAKTNLALTIVAVLTGTTYFLAIWTIHLAVIALFLWGVLVLGFFAVRSATTPLTALNALLLVFLVPVSHQIAISGQHLTTVQQLTFDLATYRIDAALGINPVAIVLGLGLDTALWRVPQASLEIVYATLSIPIGFLLIEQARRGGTDWITTIIALFGAGLAGASIYEFYPVAGPRYVFASFPEGSLALLAPDLVGLAAAPLSTEWARNGMPSLHVGWAFLAFLNACRLSRGMAWLCGAYFVLTALATVLLGHHYIIDLIVALPFALAIQAVARFTLPLAAPVRRDALIVGVVLTAAWLVVLRFAPELLVAPGVLPTLALLSTAASAILSARLVMADAPPAPATTWRTVGSAT